MIYEDLFFVVSFLVSSSHETFVQEYRWGFLFSGGGYRRVSRLRKHPTEGFTWAKTFLTCDDAKV